MTLVLENTAAGQSVPLEECDQRFKILEKIGEGTYGVVYKALDLSNNTVSTPYPFEISSLLLFSSKRTFLYLFHR